MKPGSKPQKKVNIQWTPEFAYALGLLTSDGNLYRDGRHFEFTSKDKDLVQLFIKCFGIKNKISKKTSGYTGKADYFRVQFGDVVFYKWCLKFGLMPKKSRKLKALRVPDKHFFDFLRGCFDGDGSIYAYWDPRWHSSYMFYLTFASASKPFLTWLQNTTKRMLNIQGVVNSSGGTWQLRFAKKDTLIIFDKMYHSKNAPLLKRKFVKSQKIFRINEKHNNLRR